MLIDKKQIPLPIILDAPLVAVAEKHLAASDMVMRDIVATHGPCELYLNDTNPFEKLVSSIVGQQLSAIAARTIKSRLLASIKVLTPESILYIPFEELRDAGLSSAKARYIKGLSEMVLSKQLCLDELCALQSDRVVEELIKVPGIGKWTAEMFLIFSLKHADILSLEDVGLQRAVKVLYGEQKTLKDVEKRWRPYRSVASWYLWRHLDSNIV